jgi:ATP-dependent Zn protease
METQENKQMATIEALAYHEAGHAAAAILLKRGINYASIVSSFHEKLHNN